MKFSKHIYGFDYYGPKRGQRIEVSVVAPKNVAGAILNKIGPAIESFHGWSGMPMKAEGSRRSKGVPVEVVNKVLVLRLKGMTYQDINEKLGRPRSNGTWSHRICKAAGLKIKLNETL